MSASELGRWRGWTALVTGASAGIGAEIAQQLAAAGCDLVLTARREAKLRDLADTLVEKHGVKAEVIASDLAEPDGPQKLIAELDARGLTVDVLVNNAGVGHVGHALDSNVEAELKMVRLNVTAVVELTHVLASRMVARGRGHVIQVGSMAAFFPIPRMATYAATKHFVGAYGDAMAYELRGAPVGVTTIHPGGTRSEFSETAGMNLPEAIDKTLMTSARVAEIGLRAAARGRRAVVTGRLNAAQVFLFRFVPTRLLMWIGDTIYKKLQGEPAK